jgi:hypothetical protein
LIYPPQVATRTIAASTASGGNAFPERESFQNWNGGGKPSGEICERLAERKATASSVVVSATTSFGLHIACGKASTPRIE